MTIEQQRLRVLVAGIVSLILMIGVARFSYTPLLPIMAQQAGLGAADGGWLATYNYIGYILGALIAASVSDLQLKDRLYRCGIIVAIVTTVGMGMTENLWLWGILRFLAGLSSAAGLLLGSGLIMNWLVRHQFRSELGLHFAGVGLGIAFCSLVVEVAETYLSWDQQWYLFTVFAVALAIPAWTWLPKPDQSQLGAQQAKLQDQPPGKSFINLMMAAYFCAGVGYVISATFIVAIVNQLPGTEGQGNLAFLLIGLCAAPACLIWDHIARKTGLMNALLIAFLIHIIGVLVPALDHSPAAIMIGSALYGGTFIGIVSLVLTMAGRFYPTKPAKMMGKMTISYGVAQILAPAVTGLMAEQSGSYQDGLYLAAAFMLLGTVLLLVARSKADHETAIMDQLSLPSRS
ncbi:MAG: YbfB/YjiJ family MFS transporter [Motiliproteus sp.]|nr:YbfB/YjiJ family MFS transporter [Motiliproteus sp.]MCW9051932.1 YbfB/YjiJ family MFS transporter [Motiliproteus sp.]